MITLATGTNPTKIGGSRDKLVPWLQQLLDGYRRQAPPTIKKLPVEVYVVEFLVKLGEDAKSTQLQSTTGWLTMVSFFYLLQVGEYTMKASCNSTKQTVPFKMEDVTFFGKMASGQLRQLSRAATAHEILGASSATLKLDNQKNGWKGLCIHQEATGNAITCPVLALAKQYIHIRDNTNDFSTPLAEYFLDDERYNLADKDVSAALKLAATILQYPETKGIPVERVDTHSLRSGGANSLSLSVYSYTQIQKMGRWRGATFK